MPWGIWGSRYLKRGTSVERTDVLAVMAMAVWTTAHTLCWGLSGGGDHQAVSSTGTAYVDWVVDVFSLPRGSALASCGWTQALLCPNCSGYDVSVYEFVYLSVCCNSLGSGNLACGKTLKRCAGLLHIQIIRRKGIPFQLLLSALSLISMPKDTAKGNTRVLKASGYKEYLLLTALVLGWCCDS